MTAEQRNKSLKSLIIKNKTTQKLSPVEKELLECCKSRQPVLLYGDDNVNQNG